MEYSEPKSYIRENTMILIKQFKFDAAHYLPTYHGKCENLHGHTYKLVVKLEGKPDDEGMIIDFVELKRIVTEHVLAVLDHACLNDVLPQPSAENIALWVWSKLAEKLRRDNARLAAVEVWETETSGVLYEGELHDA